MTARHAEFEHVALFHDGPEELSRMIVPGMRDGIDRGEAMFVCVGDSQWRHLARSLGDAAEAVTYMPAGERYSRPAAAMATLHGFVQDSIRAGAPAVWSVGGIQFGGGVDDRQWFRYEAAVNDVLQDLPLRAMCLYDTSSLTGGQLAAARSTHAHAHDGAAGRRPSVTYRSDPVLEDVTAAALDALVDDAGEPVLDIEVDTPGGVRTTLTSAFEEHASAVGLADLHLVATEMVTNGMRHGSPPVALQAWRSGDRLVLRVTDLGDGIDDPYPELRPPARRVGGCGLWIIGQLAELVAFERRDPGTAVTASLRLRP
jgi:anti-sigma regulatory factor (Ser/Thr protein kinase)